MEIRGVQLVTIWNFECKACTEDPNKIQFWGILEPKKCIFTQINYIGNWIEKNKLFIILAKILNSIICLFYIASLFFHAYLTTTLFLFPPPEYEKNGSFVPLKEVDASSEVVGVVTMLNTLKHYKVTNGSEKGCCLSRRGLESSPILPYWGVESHCGVSVCIVLLCGLSDCCTAEAVGCSRNWNNGH